MDLEVARDFIGVNHRAVLATRRADGGLQMTAVSVGVDEEGRLIISSTEGTAKVRNLRRDPRASVCVIQDRFYGGSVQAEGQTEIVSLPEAMELLVDYYRRLAGEHPNWDEYREAMRNDRRVLIRIEIERAVG